jgi:hypothetical protein
MSSGTDVLVLDARDTPVAAIEVKNRPNLQPPEATIIRRNLLAHRLIAPVDYFMLVSQDIGYLWGPTKRETIDAEPDLSFPMSPVLERYSVEPNASGRLFGSQLELLVSSWIQELAGRASRAESEPELSLERAGFTSAVRCGRVATEARP